MIGMPGLLLASAVLYYFGFPNIISDQGFFAGGWLMAIPLLFVLDGRPWRARVLWGLAWGFLAYGALVWWLAPLSFVGCLAFVVALSWQGVLFALLIPASRLSRPVSLFYIPSAWVVSEYARNGMLGGFTWGLGYSQAMVPEFVQGARFGGVYLVSWLMLFFATAVYWGVREKGFKPRAFLIPCLVFFSIWAAGLLMISSEASLFEKSLRVALVQADISRADKMNSALYDENMNRHLALSARSVRQGRPDIVVWPETAFVDDVMRDVPWRSRMAWMARELKTPFLFGSALLSDDGHDLNALLLLTPQGQWKDVYYKRHLVPFTEYLPQDFFSKTVARMGGLNVYYFLPGRRAGLFYLDTPRVALGATICSEEAYPALFRELVRKGAGVLVSSLNDGWFRRPEALMLHGCMAVFRAVETGRPLVRAANTGWSAVFDGRGRVLKALPLQAAGWIAAEVQPAFGETFYVKFGDVFVWLCALLVIIISMRIKGTQYLIHFTRTLRGIKYCVPLILLLVPSRADAAAVAQRRMQQQKQMQAQAAAQYEQQVVAQQQAQQMQQAQQAAAYQQALAKKQYQEAVAQKAAAEFAAYKQAMQMAVVQKNAQMEAAARIQQMQRTLVERQAQEAAAVEQAMAYKSAAEIAAYKQAQALKVQQEVQTQAQLNEEIKQYAQYLTKQKAAAQMQMAMAQQQDTEKQLMEYAARQKAVAMKKRMEANAAIQADTRRRLGKPVGGEGLSSKEPEAALPENPEAPVPETTVGINDLWDALDRSARPWVQIVDREVKLLTVSEFIDRFARIGARIKRPPGEYVQMIDSLVRENPDLLNAAFSNLLSYAAIVEYDFDNGKNKDVLAREVLGEANFLANKHRVQAK